MLFFFSSRRRHTRSKRDWSSDVCSSDLRRIQFALDRTFAQLELSAGSWGNWTDAWRFAQDHNQTFITEQVTTAGLKQLNVNTLIFTDLTGRFLAGATVDLQTERPLDLDFAARQ